MLYGINAGILKLNVYDGGSKRDEKNKQKSLIATMMMVSVTLAFLSGCAANEKSEEEDTITVYLWGNTLNERLTPYIQSQLPDVNIEFIMGNNDLDFYKFMNHHLPPLFLT